jgi:hypothetical protein
LPVIALADAQVLPKRNGVTNPPNPGEAARRSRVSWRGGERAVERTGDAAMAETAEKWIPIGGTITEVKVPPAGTLTVEDLIARGRRIAESLGDDYERLTPEEKKTRLEVLRSWLRTPEAESPAE